MKDFIEIDVSSRRTKTPLLITLVISNGSKIVLTKKNTVFVGRKFVSVNRAKDIENYALTLRKCGF